MENNEVKKEVGSPKLSTPMAVVAGAIIIALAIMISNSSGKSVNNENVNDSVKVESEVVNIRPVDQNDHIVGNQNSKIVIVEYSDLECPFCQRFHGTMQKIVSTYKKDVAWVYRHFPLDSLHSKARKEAEATECAAELGGNDGFWKYINRLMEITPANNGLDLNQLPIIAEFADLDKNAFITCLESGKYADKVEADYQDGLKAGIQGTPHSILITKKDGKMYRIEGADSFENIKKTIDDLLK